MRDLPVEGRRVLVRVDYNVPLLERDGEILVADDTRIRQTIPTLEYLISRGAKIILASHLGRPKGKRKPSESLRPIAARLAQLLGKEIQFVEDCVGPQAERAAHSLAPGQILLLENTRFHPGEEANDPEFSRALARLADVYVNDAFAAAHRAHASTEGVAHWIAERGIGLLMEKELRFLGEELSNPARPFLVLLGGAKVSDKIGVVKRLLEKADVLAVGGAMAYTFLVAQGQEVGSSRVELDQVEIASDCLRKARERSVEFLLPQDHYIVETVDFSKRETSPGRYTLPGEPIPQGWKGVDIGPATVEAFRKVIGVARTVFWNGPMGIFEISSCAKGTLAIAQALAQANHAVTIVGGGDSVAALQEAGVADRITFVSTGGGASLEFLEGKQLPGLVCIPDRPS